MDDSTNYSTQRGQQRRRRRASCASSCHASSWWRRNVPGWQRFPRQLPRYARTEAEGVSDQHNTHKTATRNSPFFSLTTPASICGFVMSDVPFFVMTTVALNRATMASEPALSNNTWYGSNSSWFTHSTTPMRASLTSSRARMENGRVANRLFTSLMT